MASSSNAPSTTNDKPCIRCPKLKDAQNLGHGTNYPQCLKKWRFTHKKRADIKLWRSFINDNSNNVPDGLNLEDVETCKNLLRFAHQVADDIGGPDNINAQKFEGHDVTRQILETAMKAVIAAPDVSPEELVAGFQDLRIAEPSSDDNPATSDQTPSANDAGLISQTVAQTGSPSNDNASTSEQASSAANTDNVGTPATPGNTSNTSASAVTSTSTNASVATAPNPQPRTVNRIATKAESHRNVKRRTSLTRRNNDTSQPTPLDPDPHKDFNGFPEKVLERRKLTSELEMTESERHVPRKNFGPGVSIEVLSNHFKVGIGKGKTLYEYQVIGIPANASRPKKRVLILDMLESDDGLHKKRDELATDYIGKVISCSPLFGDKQTLMGTFDPAGVMVNNSQAGVRGPPPAPLQLNLQLSAKYNLDHLLQYVDGTREDYKEQGAAAALNIIIAKAVADPSNSHHAQNEDAFQLDSNRFYHRPDFKALSNSRDDDINGTNIIATRGYYSSIRPAMKSVLLNFNVVAGAFYNPKPVADYLHEMRLKNPKMSDKDFRKEAQKHLAGLRVWVNFKRAGFDRNEDEVDDPSRRSKTLCELGDRPDAQTEPDGNGGTFTIWDHLKQKYHNSEDGGAPEEADKKLLTVNVGQRSDRNNGANTKYYLARQLHVFADQPYRRVLNSTMTANMITFARQEPQQVRNLIVNEGMRSLRLDSSKDDFPPMLKKLGIAIRPAMVSLAARLLTAPQVNYSNRAELDTTRGFFDVKNEADVKFASLEKGFNTFREQRATVQFFRPTPGPPSRADECIREFFRSSASNVVQQLEFYDPARPCIGIGSFDEGDLRKQLAKLSKAMPGQKELVTQLPDLVAMVFTHDNATTHEKYRTFKIVVDQLLGVKSICINEKSAMKCVESDTKGADYFFNLSMKLNLRCGNFNHILQDPVLVPPSKLHKCDTLILGADVTHHSPGTPQGTPSIAALVGSVDGQFAKFSGSMRLNTAGVESIETMYDMAIERIKEWKKSNDGRLPQRILFYRDGVDDGQFPKVREVEVEDIRKAWIQLFKDANKKKAPTPNQKVKITAVVVKKRHHTRFFPGPGTASSKSNNCMPGTIVDSGVTSPYYLDFFLISHNALTGTARPAHYFVLENENAGMTPAALQELTFKLCFIYGKSRTSVSYVPAAYYADRLCERGSLYLKPFADRANQTGFNLTRTPTELLNDAATDFYRGGGRGDGSEGMPANPWHANHDGKMFWM